VSAAEKLPWEQLGLDAEECAQLFGCTKRNFLEAIACQPEFPVRVREKPAAWIAGEVVAWRDANRVGPRVRRQTRYSKAANS
jgi:predicted DNA-binding transcriptional regulator AlpA